MTQQTRVTDSRAQPGQSRPGLGRDWLRSANLKVPRSRSAAIRALCTMIIAPGLLALCFIVIGDAQMTTFAVFGTFASLLFASFGGSRRDKAIAYLGLAVAGSVMLTIGTAVSGSDWLAAVVTIPVAFTTYFVGVAGQNVASGVTATLLAYVLPVASPSPISVIPSRLAGWLLATAVSATAVLLLSPHSPGDRLRTAAAKAAQALACYLDAAVAGTATRDAVEASRAAKHDLMNTFSATPYRPIGIAAADQSLAAAVHMLEWCAELACDAMGDHVDLSMASPQDRKLLTESAIALRSVTALLTDRKTRFDLRPIWHARTASARHMETLTGDEATLRGQVGYAFHAQTIGLAASVAAAEATIARGRASREFIAAERRRWIDGLTEAEADSCGPVIGTERWRGRWPTRVASPMALHTSSRSVWFRNSARTAIALAGAVAVAKFSNVQHGFWVVLGTLSVLRTSASATNSTALRAVAGALVGFAVAAALLVGIGTSQAALWATLPVAAFIAVYARGAAPFAVGQAAFTVALVVLYNLLAPAGWRVGLVRIEDVAIGCAVSAVVGIFIWPHGESSVVGDNLAEALRIGADYLTSSVSCALGFGARIPAHAISAVSTGARLDDAVRGYLNEQGSKRVAKPDLWVLLMAAQRIRLTAHSLASHPGRQPKRKPADLAGPDSLVGPGYLDLVAFYDHIAAQVGPPGPGARTVAVREVPTPAPMSGGSCGSDPNVLWVMMHIQQLQARAPSLSGPAAKLAAARRTAWWRAPSSHAR